MVGMAERYRSESIRFRQFNRSIDGLMRIENARSLMAIRPFQRSTRGFELNLSIDPDVPGLNVLHESGKPIQAMRLHSVNTGLRVGACDQTSIFIAEPQFQVDLMEL